MPDDLDPVIHQPTRLRIMVLLYQNRQAAATWVRDVLGLTDGNLGSHADRLAEAGYIEEGRVLTPTGFVLRLRMTPAGDAAFTSYLADLKRLLGTEGLPPAAPASAVEKDQSTGA